MWGEKDGIKWNLVFMTPEMPLERGVQTCFWNFCFVDSIAIASKFNTIEWKWHLIFFCLLTFSLSQSQYCGDKRGGDKFGLPASTVVLAELGEVVNGVLDTKVSHTPVYKDQSR